MTAAIEQLLVSRLHRFEGRPSDGPLPPDPEELRDVVQVRAGLGLVGDRYFGRTAHRNALVTVIAQESLPPGIGLTEVRRNILVRGIDVDAHIGEVLWLDSGDGPVGLDLRRPAHPCAWLDVTVAPGARKALRGKGGARCVPVNDGVLRLGALRSWEWRPREPV